MAEKRGMASGLQWAIFLGVAALSGMLWYPLGHFVNGQYFAGDIYASARLWVWLPLVGLLSAVLYRTLTHWREGKEPAAWWVALLFPSVAVTACVSALALMGGREAGYDKYLLLYFVVGNAYAYIAFGWLIIPLAIPYAMFLGWLHRETERFAASATRRHLRHAVWGFACLGLIGASEAPRTRGLAVRSAFEQATSYLDVSFPAGTELVTNWHQDGPEGNRGIWFRSKTPFPWPVLPDQQPLTDPDEREMIRFRASEVGIPTDSSTTFAQGKGQSNGRTIQVTRIRTEDADYLEFIPW